MMQYKSIDAMIIDPICDICLLPGTFPLRILPFISGYLIFGIQKWEKKTKTI